tara:strand:- start:642 stop:1325 length:684 start_codon:yes stop_codon:yes gene_type:complete
MFTDPTILEIGVDKGQTMFPIVNALSRLCTNNDRNYLYTGIDVLLRDHVIIGASHINELNWNPSHTPNEHTAGLVDLIQRNSLEVLPALVEGPVRYSLALIDGDHNYHTVKKELELVSQVVVPEHGIIICDDYNGPGGLQDEYFSELDNFYKETGGNKNVDNLVKREDCNSGDRVGVKGAVDEFVEQNKEWTLINVNQNNEPVILCKPEFIEFEGHKVNYIGVTDNE